MVGGSQHDLKRFLAYHDGLRPHDAFSPTGVVAGMRSARLLRSKGPAVVTHRCVVSTGVSLSPNGTVQSQWRKAGSLQGSRLVLPIDRKDVIDTCRCLKHAILFSHIAILSSDEEHGARIVVMKWKLDMTLHPASRAFPFTIPVAMNQHRRLEELYLGHTGLPSLVH